MVETVSKSSGGGLVDDTENFKTGDGTSILGGKTLRVVEVGWDTEYNIVYLFNVNVNEF